MKYIVKKTTTLKTTVAGTLLLLGNFCHAQFPPILDTSDLDGNNGFVMNGGFTSERSGTSVSAAGDVNNDGFDDVIIGASGNNSTHSVCYVVFGGMPPFSASFELSTLFNNNTNGLVISGLDASRFCSSVSTAGDVNMDGKDDLIIGAPNIGKSYVVFGFDDTANNIDATSLDGDTGFVMNAITQTDNSGKSVSAGRINADNAFDLVISAPKATVNGNENAGQAHVVFGGAPPFSPSFNLSDLDGANKGFVINGIDAFDATGGSISTGDINGDGHDDVIIGATGVDANGVNSSGRTYVVYGSDQTVLADFDLSVLETDQSNGFFINGKTIYGGSAYSVRATDINGDGKDDIIIGTYNDQSIYVVFGHSGNQGNINLSSLNGNNGFEIVGNNIEFGRSVASAGDLNGDGIYDLVIGDPSIPATYVVFGSKHGLPHPFDITTLNGNNGFKINNTPNGLLGHAVSTAGDINADGIDDLLIGISGANDFKGASYIIFGDDTIFKNGFDD